MVYFRQAYLQKSKCSYDLKCQKLLDSMFKLLYLVNFICLVFLSVSNKWIHERGQEFRRPCGLTEVD